MLNYSNGLVLFLRALDRQMHEIIRQQIGTIDEAVKLDTQNS